MWPIELAATLGSSVSLLAFLVTLGLKFGFLSWIFWLLRLVPPQLFSSLLLVVSETGIKHFCFSPSLKYIDSLRMRDVRDNNVQIQTNTKTALEIDVDHRRRLIVATAKSMSIIVDA